MATKAEFVPAPARKAATPLAGASADSLICVSWPDMAAEIAPWDALAERAAEPNPFYESWYLLPSLRVLDPEGAVAILRFETDGALAGLLPVVRQRHYYRRPLPHLSSWLHANCFLGAPLVARGAERGFWQALLAWADRHAGRGLFLHLGQMPLAGPLHDALLGVLAERPGKAALVRHTERAMLASQLAPEVYLEAAMSGKKRKELRRQLARLSEEGEVRFERRCDDGELALWIDSFLHLESRGWKGRQGSALACDPATMTLFRESLEGAAARGRLERLALTLSGRPIAMLATFLTPPGAYSFKTAFDEAHARFSPGVLLQRENLAMLERDDIAWSDSCASADHPMIDHIWRERRAIGSLSIAIGGRLRRALFSPIIRAEIARSPAGRML